MDFRAVVLVLMLGLTGGASPLPIASERAALEKTSIAIRDAFARGDVEGVMAYHHPEVTKALSSSKYLVGRDAVAADLRGTMKVFRIEFVKNHLESLLIRNGTAVEISTFAIRLTARNGDAPILFRGRAMIVYVRYSASPTGWASIREIIQPAGA